MKKFKALLMALVCLTCMAFTLTACGQTPPPEDPTTEQYTVTFTSEDTVKGSVSAKTSSATTINSGDKVDAGTQITFTATANTGYSFDGWYVATTRVSSQSDYAVTISGDTTIMAKFTVNTYALNYSSADTTKGTVSSSVQTATVEYGASVTLTATPVSGYKLDGWYVADQKVCDTDVYTFTMPATDYTVEARFTVESYNFSFSAESGKGTAVSAQQLGSTVEFGTSITLTATANEGYSFDGWYIGTEKIQGAGAVYTFTMPAYDCALVAKFTANTYQLNYSSEDTSKGTVSSSSQTNTVEFGTSVTLTATALTGYRFDGWYENNALVSTLASWTFTITETRNYELVAKFTAIEHTLIFTVNNSNYGEIECNSNQIQSNTSVGYNTQLTFIATPLSDGYQFDGWYENGDLKSLNLEYIRYMPNNSLSIEARFSIKEFTLTYSVDYPDRGSVSGNNETQSTVLTSTSTVKYGDKIVLTATAKTGYSFDGWYVNNQKLNGKGARYEFEMDAHNYTVQARFRANLYNLKFSSSDTSMGTVSAVEVDIAGDKPITSTLGGAWIEYLKEVKLTAVEKSGHVFKGWYKLDSLVSSSKEFTYEMREDVTFVAKFEKAKYTLSCSSEDQTKGTVTPATTSAIEVVYNTTVTVTAQAKTGYDFSGWYNGSEKIVDAGATYTFTMTENLELIAKFVPEKRTVRFFDGNVIVHTVPVDYNTTVSRYDYVKEGYEFKGWFIDSLFATAYDFNSKVTENLDLYAKMVKDVVYYDVTFYEDDGITIIAETQKVPENTSVPLHPTASREGYNFAGWIYYNEQGEKVDYTEGEAITKDLALRATYDPIKLTVKLYKTNVKNDDNLFTTLTVNYNEKAEKPQENPDDQEQLFVKWVYFDNPTAEFDFNQKIITNVDLLAIWQPKPAETFTVNFYDDVEGQGKIIYTHVVEKNGSANAPADPTKEGHTFDGWSEEFTSVTKDLEVYPKFIVHTFKVTFKYYNGDKLETVSQTVEYNKTATEPEVPSREGYQGYDWDKDFSKVTEDLVVTAIYEPYKFTVTFKDGDQELYVFHDVEYGSVISVPDTPTKEGHTFGGWFTDAEFASGTEFDFESKITSSITVYGKFIENIIIEYDVTFYDVVDNNKVTLNTQKVVEGNSVINPGKFDKTGYTFIKWVIYDQEQQPEDFDFTAKIESDLDIYAVYQINTFKVVFKDYGGTTIKVKIGNELKEEQIVEYESSAIAPTEPTRAGYNFNGWDKSFDSVTEDLVVTATYTIQTFTVTFRVDGEDYAVQEVEFGKAINFITATKPGHVFRYWYVSNEEIEYDKTAGVTYDLVLHAKFEPYKDTSVYTVEFKVFGDMGYASYGEKQYVEKGSIATAIPDYEDQEGTIYKWCYFDEGQNKFVIFDFDTPITADLTLYAVEVE